MTQKDKRTIFALVLLLGCYTYTQGLSAGAKLIKQVLNAVTMLCETIVALAIQFPDEFGITDWLWTRGIYLAITVGAAGLAGYAFASREKSRLLGIISSVVGLVSTLLMFS